MLKNKAPDSLREHLKPGLELSGPSSRPWTPSHKGLCALAHNGGARTSSFVPPPPPPPHENPGSTPEEYILCDIKANKSTENLQNNENFVYKMNGELSTTYQQFHYQPLVFTRYLKRCSLFNDQFCSNLH